MNIKTERQTKQNFSRVRAKTSQHTIISQSDGWAEDGNNIFKKCEKCGRIKLYGICMNLDCYSKVITLCIGDVS